MAAPEALDATRSPRPAALRARAVHLKTDKLTAMSTEGLEGEKALLPVISAVLSDRRIFDGHRHYGGSMTWSLGYLPPREPDLLDALFLSAGRSLHIANAFEGKCRWMVRCVNLVEVHQNADAVATFEEIIATLPADKMLGPALHQLTGHISCDSETMDVLRRAKEARNFIAHEGANVGDLSAARAKHILAHACRLRAAVSDLAAGDNIVSQWGFHFEEPNWSLPRDLIDAYPAMIDEWVFGHFGNLLDESAALASTEAAGSAQQPS